MHQFNGCGRSRRLEATEQRLLLILPEVSLLAPRHRSRCFPLLRRRALLWRRPPSLSPSSIPTMAPTSPAALASHTMMSLCGHHVKGTAGRRGVGWRRQVKEVDRYIHQEATTSDGGGGEGSAEAEGRGSEESSSWRRRWWWIGTEHKHTPSLS
ncbi:Os04g0478800 [Oryza sativa Japonica Group]|uniref:Os04g0478800 protein n=2 Tax=Oryza sativa subsp. japonica TaxID=39947 RepID=A0A0N7KJ85_ORYSJ|nr:hypothetical protein EE612_023973 [Oryza sativa]BAS89713.1 Os04g0478800 [Oryza sativa Japonica Group]